MKTFVIALSLLASVLATSVNANAAERFNGAQFWADQDTRNGQ